MNKQKPLYRVYIALILLFVLIVSVTLYIVESNTNSMMAALTTKQVETSSRILINYVQDLSVRAKEGAEIIANSEIFSNAVKNEDQEALNIILREMSFDTDFATICNADGVVLARKHSDVSGDSVMHRTEVSAVLSGGSYTDNIDFIPDLGFMVYASTGIYCDDGDIIGVVVCGYDLANLDLLAGFAETYNCHASIFLGDTRINTTLRDEHGNLIVHRTAEHQVVQEVLGKKNTYNTRMEVAGTTYRVHHTPIIVKDEAIGMLSTAIDISASLEKQRNMQYLIILVMVIAIGAAGILFIVFSSISRKFAKTLTELTNKSETLDMLENVLDALDIYLYVTDPVTDKILYTNKALVEHLGLNAAVEGEFCWKVFQNGMSERCSYCSLDRLLEHPSEVVRWEGSNTINGRFYRNTDRLIDWPGGSKVHFCQRIDITETKQALERVERASNAKSEFLSRMSHEMRTPMNAILGMITLANKEDNSPEVKEYLRKAGISSQHLLAIINDVLNISDTEYGKLELAEDDVSLREILDQSVAVVEQNFLQKHQTFTVDLQDNLPGSIIVDKFRLSQVITNLLGNAHKFTPEGGNISLSISHADSENEQCRLLFVVEDDGIGLSKEQEERIFNAFEQADNSTTRQFGGTGLGLAISANIIKCMGGDIWVTAKPEMGSIFSFVIPVKPGEGSGCISEPEQTDEHTGLFQFNRILLADDVELNRDIFIALLEDTGVTVDCAENGNMVCQMFAEHPARYDMIFMDIHMPEMNGHDATRKIRDMDCARAKTIPIIAITADVLAQDIDKCIASGMNDHVGKPLNIDIIIEKMKHYIIGA